MNDEADRIIKEMTMAEIPRHANGKIDVTKYREQEWQGRRATAFKLECIDKKIRDNKVVRRLAYFASIGCIIIATSIVLIHVGWEFATGTATFGGAMLKLLSGIKNL